MSESINQLSVGEAGTGTTPVTKKKTGRPKGKASAGLSLDKRLKILSKIALSKDAKPADVINACMQITSLLNDKIKDTESGVQTTVIKFDKAITTKPLKPENIGQNIEQNIVKKTEEVPIIIVKPIENTSVIANVSSELMSFNFTISDTNGTE